MEDDPGSSKERGS